MNDAEILAYLESHTPLERFYLFSPPSSGEVLMKYFDGSWRYWNVMEDDDETVAQAAGFLRPKGAPVFDDYAALMKFEEEASKRSN